MRVRFVSKTCDNAEPAWVTFKFATSAGDNARRRIIQEVKRLLPSTLLRDSSLTDDGISFTVTDVAQARELLEPHLPDIAHQMT